MRLLPKISTPAAVALPGLRFGYAALTIAVVLVARALADKPCEQYKSDQCPTYRGFTGPCNLMKFLKVCECDIASTVGKDLKSCVELSNVTTKECTLDQTRPSMCTANGMAKECDVDGRCRCQTGSYWDGKECKHRDAFSFATAVECKMVTETTNNCMGPGMHKTFCYPRVVFSCTCRPGFVYVSAEEKCGLLKTFVRIQHTSTTARASSSGLLVCGAVLGTFLAQL